MLWETERFFKLLGLWAWAPLASLITNCYSNALPRVRYKWWWLILVSRKSDKKKICMWFEVRGLYTGRREKQSLVNIYLTFFQRLFHASDGLTLGINPMRSLHIWFTSNSFHLCLPKTWAHFDSCASYPPASALQWVILVEYWGPCTPSVMYCNLNLEPESLDLNPLSAVY